jgi:hypothetical protein
MTLKLIALAQPFSCGACGRNAGIYAITKLTLSVSQLTIY